VTTSQPKAQIQLEIPVDCAGMEASVTYDQEIMFEFGDVPHENLILFRNCRALQQFVNLATSILEASLRGAEQDGLTTGLVITPDWTRRRVRATPRAGDDLHEHTHG
jgi:hypothetical protein